jgi:hypothetical protein
MAPTVASHVPALRVADRRPSGAAAGPQSPPDTGVTDAHRLLGEEVSPAVELAVMDLARLVADGSRDDAEALAAIARVASRLAALHVENRELAGAPVNRRDPDEERPAPAVGSWSLANGMLNIVLGEN